MFRRIEKHILRVYLAAMVAFLPMAANAKISDWVGNAGQEFVVIVKWATIIVACIGVILAAMGLISLIVAKRNKQPTEHQPWYILGGVLCILLVPLLVSLGDSITDGNTENAVNSFMSGNNPNLGN